MSLPVPRHLNFDIPFSGETISCWAFWVFVFTGRK